jgi:NAD(P)-dependent dehydrogenase (short-subunit alcohol dehydrogenase family)
MATQNDQGSKPVQVGTRRYPERFDDEQLPKPGIEADLKTQPMFEAPHYAGSAKLKGMVALITGGDSGIGRAVAVLYAREGADVAISYLCEHEDARTTQEAVEKEGARCILIPGDVSEAKHCEHCVKETISQFGRLDILVNNAAYQQHVDDIVDLTDEQFDRTLKTNLYGYFFMSRAAVPHIVHGGSIIMSGSITGIDGSKDLLDYAMTKGGIHAFTRSLAAHVLDRGIRVNAIAPGPVWTPLNPSDKDPSDVAKFGSKTAMGRAAQPEEIAPAYVFLAAPACASFITGEILPIIGGPR